LVQGERGCTGLSTHIPWSSCACSAVDANDRRRDEEGRATRANEERRACIVVVVVVVMVVMMGVVATKKGRTNKHKQLAGNR
jgi:hypothetical protein